MGNWKVSVLDPQVAELLHESGNQRKTWIRNYNWRAGHMPMSFETHRNGCCYLKIDIRENGEVPRT